MFDCALSKSELEKICEFPNYIKKYQERDEDLTRFAYSNAYVIRKMFLYPKFFEIYFGIEHGITINDEILKEDIIQDIDIALYGRKRKKDNYYGIKLINIEYPFLFYKRKFNIKQKKNAKGTIVFPMHASLHISREYDIYSYIKELKNLPKEFHPLLICLHYSDVLKGHHHIWYDEGFYVTSAGNGYREDFVKRFYKILSSVKYATANETTSSLFYAVDFGIPFFLYGNRKVKDVKLHSVAEKYALNNYKMDLAKKYGVEKYFNKITTTISKEQKEYVDKVLGKDEKKTNRLYVSLILYREWIKAQIKKIKRFIEVTKLKKYSKYLTQGILTHMTKEEQLSLIKYAINKEVVEIGSFLGANTVNIAKVAKKIYALDNWNRHFEGAFLEFKKNIENYNNIFVFNNTFDNIYRNFFQKVDVVIVDGEHDTLEHVCRDVNFALKILKNKGILIIHHLRWTPFVKMCLWEKRNKVKRINNLKNLWIGVKVED